MPSESVLRSERYFAPKVQPEVRIGMGKAERSRVKRAQIGVFEALDGRPDPVELLTSQDDCRVQDLLPIRYGRMSESAFRFYRGAASIMAWDLGNAPSTRLNVQSCGDAHLTNFGIYASPERRLVFDLNDFDETHAAPFEWDLKRLVTSIIVAGRENGFSAKDVRAAANSTARAYRQATLGFAQEPTLSVWYESVDVASLLEAMKAKQRKRAEKGLKSLGKRTSLGSLDKLTEVVEGKRVIKEKPNLVKRVSFEQGGEGFVRAFDGYMRSLAPELRVLTDRYRLVDIAFKVVGVGSVGTRAWVLLLDGEGPGDDPLFLQFKEAGPSVLEPFTAASRFRHHGKRVVTGQRVMQATSDIFLGWATGGDGTHYYGRQLRDFKGSPVPEEWAEEDLERFGRTCAWTLARAHARSHDPAPAAGYMGESDAFDRAITAYAEAYADQNERDYERLLRAIDSGELPAQKGI